MRPATRPLALAVSGLGLVDPDTPVIHADDAGLLRGQAAFESVRVYRGRPFALTEHLERLESSAERLRLDMPPRGDLDALASIVLDDAGIADCSLRFTVTGGRGDGSGAVAMVALLPLPEDLEMRRQAGIRLVSLQLGIDPSLRRDAPWLLHGVKSTSYAVNMAAADEARRRGADDAVFVAADDSVLEGTVTNIWWRHGDTLFTPSLELGVLAGVTRAWIVRQAPSVGYRVEQGWFPLSELAGADEAFSSSSVREIMPVVALDGGAVGSGRPGPAAAALQGALRRAAQG